MKIQTKKEMPSKQLTPPTAFGVRNGAGEPLPTLFRKKMERTFRADFTKVRVHRDPDAAKIGALAFARGENLHFAPGRYDTRGHEGRRLIGHELAHVLQQRAGRVPTGRGRGDFVFSSRRLETEAERSGESVVSRREGGPLRILPAPRNTRVGLGSSNAAQCAFKFTESDSTVTSGRPISIEGKIETGENKGSKADSRVSRPLNIISRESGAFTGGKQFEAAHIVADEFGGRGVAKNLLPVISDFNQTTYKARVENKVKASLQAGKSLDVKAKASYPADKGATFNDLLSGEQDSKLEENAGQSDEVKAMRNFMYALLYAVPQKLEFEAKTADAAKTSIVDENNLNPRSKIGALNPPYGADIRNAKEDVEATTGLLKNTAIRTRFNKINALIE